MHTFVRNMISYKLSNAATHAVSNDWIYIAAILTPTAGAYNTFATSDLKLSISTKCTCLHECELHNWYMLDIVLFIVLFQVHNAAVSTWVKD